MTAFRLYSHDELGTDGYPIAWHEMLKHQVRADAGHRCVRCGHPYEVGSGTGEMTDPTPHSSAIVEEFCLNQRALDIALENVADETGQLQDELLIRSARRTHYSACDERCAHHGAHRWRWAGDDEWREETEAEYQTGYSLSAYRPGSLEIQAAWRILTVHHLNGVKADCRWWNLAALCQRCHLQVQGKVQMQRVWPWEHTPWFRPYVAGFYAASYLGEDLTRSEVDARVDELLSLERVA